VADALAALAIVRFGGVAGITRRRSVDAAALTAAQKQALEALAAASPAPPARGADRFSFALTLSYQSGTTREITVPEDAIPPALAELLR
jgi:hypothetical protein